MSSARMGSSGPPPPLIWRALQPPDGASSSSKRAHCPDRSAFTRPQFADTITDHPPTNSNGAALVRPSGYPHESRIFPEIKLFRKTGDRPTIFAPRRRAHCGFPVAADTILQFPKAIGFPRRVYGCTLPAGAGNISIYFLYTPTLYDVRNSKTI